MNVTIISGSHRGNSQSEKTANYCLKRIKDLELFSNVNYLNLSQEDIPFWDENMEKQKPAWKAYWDTISEKLKNSDAFIIVSPEWSGMVPAKLKNFFLFTNQSDTGHKPALIITVSSGVGGAYPVNELRTSSYKNTKICYIPEHIIIREVKNKLNNKEADGEQDAYIRKRLDFALKLLKEYAVGMQDIRTANLPFDDYPYGMS